jgi:predicted kinase
MKSLSLSQPHVIIMVGIPGSGKSFFAEKFADTFHAPFVSQSQIAQLGEITENQASKLAFHQVNELLKTSKSIVVDGMGETRTERAEIAKKARANGYEPLVLWVQTDPATAKMRSTKMLKDKTSPTLSTDEFDRRVKRFTAPNGIEKPLVISGKHTYASQAKVVLKKLSAPRGVTIAQRETPERAPTPARPRRQNITIR